MIAGEDWAHAEIALPASIADELGEYRFHPALIDGAFQTLFGAPFLGQEENEDPYLPTRIRRCAVYGGPEEHMTVRVDVLSATREEVESNITVTGRSGRPLVVIDGFSVQSLGASSRMSPDRIDKGLYELQWCELTDDTHQQRTDHRSWLVLLDNSGAGRRSRRNYVAGGTGSTPSHRAADRSPKSGAAMSSTPPIRVRSIS